MIMISSTHMIASGLLTYSMKRLAGDLIDRHSFNYLGEKKAYILQAFLYIGTFFYLQRIFANQKNLDINQFLNARETNGEVMLGIVMNRYPHKVDQSKFKEILMQKS